MDKGKLVPIVITLVLVVVAGYLFLRIKENDVHFNNMEITYNNDVKSYESLKLDDVIKIGDYEFEIVSINKKNVVLRSKEYISNNNEFSVKMGSESQICFTENNCATLILR